MRTEPTGADLRAPQTQGPNAVEYLRLRDASPAIGDERCAYSGRMNYKSEYLLRSQADVRLRGRPKQSLIFPIELRSAFVAD